MTIDTLFGPIPSSKRQRSLRLKIIRPVYESLKINDMAAAYLEGPPSFSTATQVFDWFQFLRQETKEHFLTMHLNNKNRVLCIEIVSTGSLTAAVVHPREVFKSALLSSAASLILVHNHPSGDCRPSQEDHEITKRLQQGGELLGIRVLDHIILGDTYYSFADQGYL